MQNLFHLVGSFIDHSQINQKQSRIVIKNLIYKSRLHICIKIRHQPVRKLLQNIGLFQADRKHDLFRDKDAERNRLIKPLPLFCTYHRDIGQYHRIIIFMFQTRTFFLIQRRPQIVQIDLVFFCHHLKFCSVRIRHHDPGFAFNLGNLS